MIDGNKIRFKDKDLDMYCAENTIESVEKEIDRCNEYFAQRGLQGYPQSKNEFDLRIETMYLPFLGAALNKLKQK